MDGCLSVERVFLELCCSGFNWGANAAKVLIAEKDKFQRIAANRRNDVGIKP